MSTHVKALGMGELVIKPICDSNIYPKKMSEPRVLHGLFSSSQQIIKIQSKCIIFIYSWYKRLNGVQQPIYSKSVYKERARAVRVKQHLSGRIGLCGWLGVGCKTGLILKA